MDFLEGNLLEIYLSGMLIIPVIAAVTEGMGLWKYNYDKDTLAGAVGLALWPLVLAFFLAMITVGAILSVPILIGYQIGKLFRVRNK